MFIKLIFQNEEKKIYLKEEFQNIDYVKNIAKEFSKIEESKIIMYSKDLEEKIIYWNDNYNLEYIIESSKLLKNIFLEINIFKKNHNFIENDLKKIEINKSMNSFGKSFEKINDSKSDLNSDKIFDKKIIKNDKINDDLKNIIKFQLKKEIREELEIEINNEMKNLENKLIKKLNLKEKEVSDKNEIRIKNLMKDKLKKLKNKFINKNLNNNDKNNNIIHKNIICNICYKKDFTGFRYKCLVCKDYDLCEKCLISNPHNHDLLKIKISNYKYYEPLVEFYNLNIINNRDIDYNTLVKTTFNCDNCNWKSPIEGNRNKCLVCKDFDLCDNCEKLGIHNHNMMIIKNDEFLDYESIVDYYNVKFFEEYERKY